MISLRLHAEDFEEDGKGEEVRQLGCSAGGEQLAPPRDTRLWVASGGQDTDAVVRYYYREIEGRKMMLKKRGRVSTSSSRTVKHEQRSEFFPQKGPRCLV